MTIIAVNQLPYMTEHIPGIGGQIKRYWEDFIVEEIPLYTPSGEGTHLYVYVEKRGMATLDVIVKLARNLKISRQSIGHAGLKDAKAITRQWLSLEHVTKDDLEKLEIHNVAVLNAEYHTNKLRIGHLKANFFTIRIRDFHVPLDVAEERTREVMDYLCQYGVPNFFGPQRFGKRRDSPSLGFYIIHNEIDNFMDLYLGTPRETDQSPIFDARLSYDQGHYREAHDAWPNQFHDQRLSLRALMKGKSREEAFKYFINQQVKRFYVSSLQSQLFNQVLTKRMPDINKLIPGDIAWKHNNGACFAVVSPEAEQPRCEAFEISPTGPLFGRQMMEPGEEAGKIEQSVLEDNRIDRLHFKAAEFQKIKGGRRMLRFQPQDIAISSGSDEKSPYLELKFGLGSGCYATTVIREITKGAIK